jgi:hypothetical protein
VLRETQEPQGLILENRDIRAMNSVIRILWLIPTICPTIFGAVGGQPSSLQTGATELIWRLSFNFPIRIP